MLTIRPGHQGTGQARARRIHEARRYSEEGPMAWRVRRPIGTSRHPNNVSIPIRDPQRLCDRCRAVWQLDALHQFELYLQPQRLDRYHRQTTCRLLPSIEGHRARRRAHVQLRQELLWAGGIQVWLFGDEASAYAGRGEGEGKGKAEEEGSIGAMAAEMMLRIDENDSF